MVKLKDTIRTKVNISSKLLGKWETVIPIIKNNYIIDTKEISARAAESYRGDLYGLFKTELQIPDEFIYPHIRVNGYNSSYDYDSNKLTFQLIDVEKLGMYMTLFNKSIKDELNDRSL